ncbi:FAD/NAD(P)-binding protein [Streptomyces sp. NBC_00154]|uniref:FAD/NAD(P)-binding protein n=1 Tax=Streptomyces sp. NBC_00154 TaxID=2975670 RepID=UPI00225AD1DA|nr:FAD/NAD(P)-binding protein [Streptomyces sp. NBC_00154]MCX5317539.1 FAD/NAD(P)-binding protein [Streptomyces sp. NBC_00154]
MTASATLTAQPGTVPIPYRVVEREAETPDTATIFLEPVRSALQPFTPGQFAMVYAFGVGDIPLSVSGIDGHRLTHTVRTVGAVSGALHRLRRGDTVGVRGPFGTGWELPAAVGNDLLVVAGGIGLAPLRPLVRDALAAPERYGRLNVLIGARTPHELLYAEDVRGWQSAARVLTTVDRADPLWQGEVGVVTTLLDRVAFGPAASAAFICGPEPMIRATAGELVHRGVDPEVIRVSLERNVHCATGHCGHCQLGPLLLCRDGPVVSWSKAQRLLMVREL